MTVEYIANKDVNLQFGESTLTLKEGDKVSEAVYKAHTKHFDVIGKAAEVITEIVEAPVEVKEEILTETSSEVEVTTEETIEETTAEEVQEIIEEAVEAIVEVQNKKKK